jgi:hypothetical protein
LHRVDQRPAGTPVAVEPVQIFAADQKRGHAPPVGSDPHPVQPPAHAQQKSALEQISHFDATLHKGLTSFQIFDFFGEMR